MELCLTFLAVVLFFLISYMLGSIFNKFVSKEENPLFIGFFLYYALFEIIALPLILMQKSLSTLMFTWGFVCVMVAAFFLYALVKNKKGINEVIAKNKDRYSDFTQKISWLCSVVLVGLETLFSLLHPNNSWDTTFYIGTVVKSVDTNTMYIYDGYTGWKNVFINIKYAMCSFYMNDALIGIITKVHGAIICRFFNTVICHLIAAYIVYLLGRELFIEKKAAYGMVCVFAVANLGLGTGYLANDFLLNRSYEAKAFCANVVVPGLLLVLIRILKNSDNRKKWISLLVVNIASVSISSSSLLLVPLMCALLIGTNIFVTKKWNHILWLLICCIPNVMYLLLYFINQFQIIQIEIL